MDNILKKIMKNGEGIYCHFVNHLGRGCSITAVLDANMHPEEVGNRTGHRDVKSMFESSYKISNERKKSNTLAVMGSVEAQKCGAVRVSGCGVRQAVPRQLLSDENVEIVPESKASKVFTVKGKVVG